jgi:hypothetical protein
MAARYDRIEGIYRDYNRNRIKNEDSSNNEKDEHSKISTASSILSGMYATFYISKLMTLIKIDRELRTHSKLYCVQKNHTTMITIEILHKD